MSQYIAKRLLSVVPVLLGITLLVFGFLHLIPGDPAVVLLGERATPDQIEAFRLRLGLNQPLALQYLTFLNRLVHLDFGDSLISGIPVMQEIRSRWTASFELTATALLIAVGVGIPLGTIAAVRKHSWLDFLVLNSSLLGVSLPVYWLGLLMVYLFAVNLHWLPPSGRTGVDVGLSLQPLTGFYVLDAMLRLNGRAIGDALAHLILPALTLSTIPLAILTRMTRATLLETFSQDYIRTAQAKGLPELWVVGQHALKNALLPVVTVAGLQFGTLLSSAILTETIFSWPGLGSWLYDGILARDYPVVQGGVVFVAVTFVLINLLVDLAYALLDPRIKYD